MKLRSMMIALCLVPLSLTVHANTTATLIDDAQEDVGAQIMLTDDGTPVALGEDSGMTVDEASLSPTGGGCKSISGVASIYGLGHGSGDGAHQRLAGGGRLNPAAYTAAMLHAPLGSIATVTGNGKTIKVRINDRGPYARGRIIDLTPAAAHGLGFSENGAGTARVQVTICR